MIHPPDDRIAYYRRLSTEKRQQKNTLKKPSESLFLCKSGRCRGSCEESRCCRSWGRLGVTVSNERRSRVFCVSFVLACIAFFCQLVVSMGVTKSNTLLTHVAWSRGEFVPPHNLTSKWTIWIGSEHYVIQRGEHAPLVGIDWEDDGACEFPNSTAEAKREAEKYCESCREQSGPSIFMAIIAAIFSLQGIRFNLMRGGSGEYDMNSYKGLGAFHCASVVLLNVGTIVTFWVACVDELDRATTENNFIPGFGLILLLLVVTIKFLNLIVHLCIAAPRGRWHDDLFEGEEENDSDVLLLSVDQSEA